jgi:hypothetical protein
LYYNYISYEYKRRGKSGHKKGELFRRKGGSGQEKGELSKRRGKTREEQKRAVLTKAL